MLEIWTRSHQNDDVREANSRRIIQEINQIWFDKNLIFKENVKSTQGNLL